MEEVHRRLTVTAALEEDHIMSDSKDVMAGCVNNRRSGRVSVMSTPDAGVQKARSTAVK